MGAKALPTYSLKAHANITAEGGAAYVICLTASIRFTGVFAHVDVRPLSTVLDFFG
jgi:hypothetical protein